MFLKHATSQVKAGMNGAFKARRGLKAVLCTALLLGGTGVAGSPGQADAAPAASGVTILLDGYPLPFPQQPVIIQGTTMVPFRAISEALGIKVEWNQSAKRITATGKDNKKITLTLGNATATVDGQAVKLNVAPRTIADTTMIPLSFFSSTFGAGVAWDQSSKTVSIVSPQSDMYTMAFYAHRSFGEVSLIPSFDAVAFGWSRIDRSGTYTTTGQEFWWPEAAGDITPESIVNDAAAGGTTPYLMVYSGDKELELTRNLEDPALGAQTIDAIMKTATEKGFKGVALDLEGLGMTGDKAKARADFNAFVAKLSERTRQAGLKLTVIAHPLNSVYHGYDYKTLSSLADDIVIMAYAYEGEKGPEPTDKVDEAIRLALKEADAEKLVLGISVFSENQSSVNVKIGLAKRYGLKGIAIWRLGLIGEPVWNEMNKAAAF